MSAAPLELSFARDVRLARWIGVGCLAVGLLAVVSLLRGDPAADENGAAGTVAAWVGLGVFGGIGAAVLWGLRSASSAALRIDSTGITSTTGRGAVAFGWSDLAATDLQVRVRRAPRNDVIDPRALRTRVTIHLRLAPLDADVVGDPVFTRAIRIMAPPLTTGESLPRVDQIDAAMREFGAATYRGVVQA